jgi:hypothetical protein
MKKWTVYYRTKGVGRGKSHECVSRKGAVKFIVALKKSGDSYSSLRIGGKYASPSLTIELDRESERILSANSN